MFGITVVGLFSIVFALAITAYVTSLENPHSPGTDEYTALRVCRVGLVLLAWSFGFGILGLVFDFTAFVLGVVGIVKGRGLYGSMLIAGSVIVPVVGTLVTVASIAK